jgi:Stage II sporulation protein E (SpoIIE)
VPLLGPPQLLQVFLQSAQQPYAVQFPWGLVVVSAACGAVGIISLTGLAAVYGCNSLNQVLQTTIPLQLAFSVTLIAILLVLFPLPLAAMHLLSVAKPLWRRLNFAASGIALFYYMMVFFPDLGLLPHTAALDRIQNLSPAFHLPFILLLLAITIDGLRTIGRKAWLLLTPGFLFAACTVFGLLGNYPAFAIISELILAMVPLSILIIFLVRFTRQQRENARLVDDLKQAAEVQQVLIPEQLPRIPNLSIHTEYRPAREVGGDFFQIIPHPNDQSVLIVAGDVTGKGLQAGMLVSLLVGAIRTAADTTSDPLPLNRRLLGRGHAQATSVSPPKAAPLSPTPATSLPTSTAPPSPSA